MLTGAVQVTIRSWGFSEAMTEKLESRAAEPNTGFPGCLQSHALPYDWSADRASLVRSNRRRAEPMIHFLAYGQNRMMCG